MINRKLRVPGNVLLCRGIITLKALRPPFTISGTASDRKDHAKQNAVLRALYVLHA